MNTLKELSENELTMRMLKNGTVTNQILAQIVYIIVVHLIKGMREPKSTDEVFAGAQWKQQEPPLEQKYVVLKRRMIRAEMRATQKNA